MERYALALFCLSLVAGQADAVAMSHETAGARRSPVPNFVLLDQRGRAHELARAPGRALILFVTGNGCPIARQSVPALKQLRQAYLDRGVDVWMLDSNIQDDRASIAKEAEDLDVGRIPILQDEAQLVARQLKIDHTGEAIVISLRDRRIFYRGAIDDRLNVGAQRPVADHHYLADALDAFLNGKPVSLPRAPVAGCSVTFDAGREISYEHDVAPLVASACGACHGPAGWAKPRFLSYRALKGVSNDLKKVLLMGSMPPGRADPHEGLKLGVPALDAADAQVLWRWIDQGAPRGAGEDPLLASGGKTEAATAPGKPRLAGALGPPAGGSPPGPPVSLYAAEADEVSVAPDEPEGRAFGMYRFARAAVIQELIPRTDARGIWFRYEALYPDGTRETLLSLPVFDPRWQGSYRLAKPKSVPAGTRLLASAGYDNSSRNPANPNPRVRLACRQAACAKAFWGGVSVRETGGKGSAGSLSAVHHPGSAKAAP